MKLNVCVVLLVGVGLLTSSPSVAGPSVAPAVKLPKQLTTPTGNFITLYAYAPATSKQHVASFDVQICTSPHTPKITEAYPPFFTLSLTGRPSAHVLAKAAKSPPLLVTPLKPKQCVRGWISFAVPAGAHASALVYTYGKPISWPLG